MSGRKFTELNAGTVGANSIFAQAQAPATPGDPYTSTKVSATDVGNFVNGTQAYADIGNVTPLAAIAALQQGGASTANANIADEYDSSHTYNTGDRVIYEGVLYVCNDDNVTGAWDSTKWDSATIDEIISALTAADIPYSSGVSVADKLDDMTTYSSTEKAVGTWIDGSTIYQKTVDCGTMPNNTTINIDTQISNLARVIELKGTCFNSNTGSVLPLPMIGSNNYLSLSMLGTNISIGTNVDRSGYTGYVTVTYLKSV